jgi:septal ring factor EnvC (AmiA/AmiB activator)
MRSPWDSFREISSAAAEWESELSQNEQEIAALERDLQQKSDVLRTLQLELDVLEDRQLRFARLLEILEAASGSPKVSDRKGEMLHIAELLYAALAEHGRRIAKHQNNPETLKHLLLLLADFHSRFQNLKVTAFRRGMIPSQVAFQQAAAGIEVDDQDP